ncbi:hypothetical protein [Streptomyces sp. NBC_00209]|uniref:hypothetical protein n=1 Tax=Streptomyces sp. NBC_00209 TaxID=2975682 RepID=UPI00386DB133
MTVRPRGELLTAAPLCDEEHVLVAAPRWAGRLGPGTLRRNGPMVLEQLPVVEVHESLPLISRCWTDPPVPPLRTYFLATRTDTLALPHLARAHEWLLRAAADW